MPALETVLKFPAACGQYLEVPTQTDILAYVKVVDHDVDVWRPTRLRALGNGVYEMLEGAPFGEDWEHEAPARVRCEVKPLMGAQRLVITSLAD
jgi:hypothetical protein